jgi:hypothetical protein
LGRFQSIDVLLCSAWLTRSRRVLGIDLEFKGADREISIGSTTAGVIGILKLKISLRN